MPSKSKIKNTIKANMAWLFLLVLIVLGLGSGNQVFQQLSTQQTNTFDEFDTAQTTTNGTTQKAETAAPYVNLDTQVSNALPGSVIAGGVRAQQQAAINTVTNQFATYAKARPVTATEAKYNGSSAGATLQAVPKTQVKAPSGNSNDVTLTGNTAWVAPANKLYDLHVKEGSTYLVESDPLFINKDQYLSSDYALKQLTINPERTLKRYGDVFPEQRAFVSQLVTMTGHANLAGYDSDGLVQHQTLREAHGSCLFDFGVSKIRYWPLKCMRMNGGGRT